MEKVGQGRECRLAALPENFDAALYPAEHGTEAGHFLGDCDTMDFPEFCNTYICSKCGTCLVDATPDQERVAGEMHAGSPSCDGLLVPTGFFPLHFKSSHSILGWDDTMRNTWH